MTTQQQITEVQGYDKAVALLAMSTEKLMMLHMKMLSSNKTQCITSGYIDNVAWYNNHDKFREGFTIQLRDKEGKLYSGTEKFFGDFDYFEISESSLSYILHVQYKDKSFFDIEIFC